MMWLIFTILIAVPSVRSDFGEYLALTDSSQKVTLRTTNHPKKECSWLISAPSNEVKWKVLCGVATTMLVKCALASFYSDYIDLNITMCVGESISEILKGSTPTSNFTVRRCISVNSAYKEVTFMVSYNPKDSSTSVKPSCKCGKKKVQRIIGGKETTPNNYPWMALLMFKSPRYQFCGGSLIANQWVLTATHCVTKKKPTDILVVLGEHDLTSSDSLSKSFDVSDIIIHENYNQDVLHNNDITLLKLSKPVDFNEVIGPICLPFSYKDYDFSDKIGIAIGWGDTIQGDDQIVSKVLKEINQTIIMPDKCTRSSGYDWTENQINENMICALAQSGSLYDGDSGSPLVWRSDFSNLYFQLGLSSFIRDTADPNTPDVYARVSQFVDWIVAKTGLSEEFCNKI